MSVDLVVEHRLRRIEQAIRSGSTMAEGTTIEWLADDLIPRVFDSGRAPATLSPVQQRLATILVYVGSKHVDRLGIQLAATEVRRALAIDERPIRLHRPNIDLADWTVEHDDIVLGYGSGQKTDVPGVTVIDGTHVLAACIADVDVAELGHLFEGTGLVGLVGDDAVVDWIAAGNRCDSIRVLGLRRPKRSVARLAGSSFLAGVRRLLVDSASGVAALLESSHATRVEALTWRWANADELVAAGALPALRSLRVVVGVEQRPATMDRLTALFAATRAPIARLALHAMDVPIDAVAGSDSLALAELDVAKSLLRGGELLGALRGLVRFDATDSSFDDNAAAALAACACLEVANLAGTAIGDAGASALADGAPGRLRVLDLRRTAVRDLAVVDRLASLPSLEQLHLPDRVAIELAIAGRQPRGVVVPSASALRDPQRSLPPHDGYFSVRGDTPAAVHRAAVAAGRWPASPPGFTRRFVLRKTERCDYCNGFSWTSEGHCPMHMAEREIRHDGPLPPDERLTRIVASTATSVARAEALAATIAPMVAHLGGRPHQIVWHFGRSTTRPRSFIERLAIGVDLAETIYWAHACLHAGVGDRALFEAAAEIVDLGYDFHAIDGAAIHLAMPETLK